MNKIEEITSAIAGNIDDILRHPSFYKWATKGNGHIQKTGDIIFINNSFVFRDVKTKKSDLHLAVKIDQDFKRSGNVFIGNTNMNSDFKYCTSPAERNSLIPLHVMIGDQMHSLGQLVFILIGCVKDQVTLETRLSHPIFKKLIWKPRIKSEIHIGTEEIAIRDIQQWEIIWQILKAHFLKMLEGNPQKYLETKYKKASTKKSNKDISQKSPEQEAIELQKTIESEVDELKKAMEAGILDLQDQAFASVVIPASNKKNKGSRPHILCRIVDALLIEREKYSAALKDLDNHAPNAEQSFHEILRISYNFEKEAITLLNLIVSVCDLKPLILWGTIYRHYDLSEAFRDLPWFTKAYKPSLRNYKSIIDEARNSAFHNIFPFHKTLEIALPQSALREARLRIFSEYDNKKQNALEFQDKELVDVLIEFTRARTRPAAMEFWEKNLVVMNALITLFGETGRFLSVLR